MFTELLWISLVAFGAPLVVTLAPKLRVPAIVLEIVGGIIIGPQLLNVVRPDVHVELLSSIGLAFLLFLAGLEVDLSRLRGPLPALPLPPLTPPLGPPPLPPSLLTLFATP